MNRGSTFTQISPSDPADLPGLPSAVELDATYANTYATITAIAPCGLNPNPGTGAGAYSNTIYVGTDTGLVWKTTNAGVSWTQLTSSLPTLWVNTIAVDQTDCNHVLIGFSGFRVGDNTSHLYESTDGGTTFSSVSGNLPNAPIEKVLYDRSDNLILAATDLGVFYLRDPLDLPEQPTTCRASVRACRRRRTWTFSSSGGNTKLFRGHVRPRYLLGHAAEGLYASDLVPCGHACRDQQLVRLHADLDDRGFDGQNGSGVEDTQYALDGGSYQDYTAPFTVAGIWKPHAALPLDRLRGATRRRRSSFSFQTDTTPPVVTPPANVSVSSATPTASPTRTQPPRRTGRGTDRDLRARVGLDVPGRSDQRALLGDRPGRPCRNGDLQGHGRHGRYRSGHHDAHEPLARGDKCLRRGWNVRRIGDRHDRRDRLGDVRAVVRLDVCTRLDARLV